MKGSKDLLGSVLKTTQMGQIGIRSLMDRGIHKNLHAALKRQLEEYDRIETQAHEIARERGWQLKELDPAIRRMADMMTMAKMAFCRTDSRAAQMMILGNMRGVIKTIRNLHQYNHNDQRISHLCQQLLDHENANIRQMQGYL